MKICFISDTHGTRPKLPEADLLVHCGDLTNTGTTEQIETEVDWLASERPKFRLGISYTSGNHDRNLDPAEEKKAFDYWLRDPKRGPNPPTKKKKTREKIEKKIKDAGIILLNNSGMEIEGISFWGSPMTNRFMDWSFMETEAGLMKYWQQIPEKTQVLITHGPAQYLRDLCGSGAVGSSTLRWYLENHLPNLKVHAFGHIHEGAGYHQEGRYLCLNASVLDGHYSGFNDIYVVDTDTWQVCDTKVDTDV